MEDYSSDFIKQFKADAQIVVPEEKQQAWELKILSKYFKVDGKSTKMKYISHLKAEFEDTEIDEMYDVFEKLRRSGMIQTSGNNSFITQVGITYYHKNR